MRVTGLTILLLGLLISGCAAAPGSAERELERAESVYTSLIGMGLVRGEEVRRVQNFRISNWQDIDARTLVLRAGVRDRYLVELLSYCTGLETAFGIGLASDTGSLMATDAILVRGMGGRLERCAISRIWALEELPGYDAAQPEE